MLATVLIITHQSNFEYEVINDRAIEYCFTLFRYKLVIMLVSMMTNDKRGPSTFLPTKMLQNSPNRYYVTYWCVCMNINE